VTSVRPERESSRPPPTTIFVSDPSVEAERVAQALRGAGYLVVDVPMSMLVARVAVQRPRVILVDADADGATESVARMRGLPEAETIDVVFIGRGAAATGTDGAVLEPDATGFFSRPVDVAALLKKVDALTGGPGPAVEGPGPRASIPPPPLAPSIGSSRPSSLLPSPSMRASPLPPPPPSMMRPSQSAPPPPNLPSIHTGRRLSVQGQLSDELARLLADAEERIGAQQPLESNPPTPEEEIEAVLPEEILAALDEPLEEDDDDDDEINESFAGSNNRVTTAGGVRHTTGASRRLTGAPILRRAELEERERSAERLASRAAASDAGSSSGSSGALSTGQILVPPPPTAIPSDVLIDTGAPSSEDDGLSEVAPALAPSFAAASAARTELPPAKAWTSDPPAVESSRSVVPYLPPIPPPAFSSTLGSEELVQNLGAAFEPPLTKPLNVSQASQKAESVPPPLPIPAVLGPTDAARALARAIASRVTGALSFESKDGVRRAMLREGDIVTAASGVDDESLIAFLVARGDLPRERQAQLAGRFATFGRHAGAALVAHGHLRQDQLWTVLRGHAEWILARALLIDDGTATVELEPPGRLRQEPSVFGGSTGAEVFVEVVRRVVAPEDAVQRLGGASSRIAEGPCASLLTECALSTAEVQALDRGRGGTVGEALEGAFYADTAAVLYALAELGVIEVIRAVSPVAVSERPRPNEIDALDTEAIRARVRARVALVDEGDYFAVLGVPHAATGYEIRRAFLELRRAFDPARLLTPDLHDLAPDVRKIVMVLEEAYEILRDGARRERYRRAIDASPGM